MSILTDVRQIAESSPELAAIVRAEPHKNCDRPPSMCEAHHIWHSASGGPTNLANLKLLCWFHHKEQHIHDARARSG